MKSIYKLKADKYKSARGGFSKFLTIFCSQCKHSILLYQKDGSGQLKRLYLDRIFAPSHLEALQYTKTIKEVPNLVCTHCHALIGTPFIYKKEQRKAFLLNPTSFLKKIGKGEYLANVLE